MKQCAKCKQFKKVDQFHKNKTKKDGLHHICKACIKAYQQSEKGKEAKKRADEKYKASLQGRLVHLMARRKYNRSKNGQIKNRQFADKYLQTEKGKEVYQKTHNNYTERNPHKLKAQSAVAGAVARDRLPRASTQNCADCGNQAQEYHHWSYSPEHWLDVIPLCKKCHGIRHRKN